MNYKAIGKRIRKYRKSLSLSQEQLAEMVGISTTHMSHIETGNTKLSLAVLVEISKSLSISMDTIIFGQEKLSDDKANSEIHELLASCSPAQTQVLLEVIRATKLSLSKYYEQDVSMLQTKSTLSREDFEP